MDAYSLQRPQRYKFKTNRVISQGIGFLYDCDLADVSNLSTENDGVKYLLVVIDVFSRFLWVVPLKNKLHGSVISGLREIFQTSKPKELRTDKGSEFKNKWMTSFLKDQGVHHYVTQNITKANYAERVIRTLKVLMYRYITHKRSYRYLDVLQDLVHNYNHRVHRALEGLSPAEITKNNEALLWKHMYVDSMKPKSSVKKIRKPTKKFKFKLGDYVRISSTKTTFQRDYEQKWTEELFVIDRRYLRQGIPVYKLKDLLKDPVEGSFYESELQGADGQQDTWKLEKIIKRRMRRGQPEVFVKWWGYPNKFNS